MKHVNAKHFWEVIENFDSAPLGSRPVVDIDLQEHECFTQVSICGRTIGEEVTCLRSGRTRCYLTEEV
jgi:hypothetical protein